MNHDHDEPGVPRWITLAATLRAEPEPGTLARVARRLAARRAEPAWLRWLARPVAVVTSAALLIVSAVAGNALLSSPSRENADEGALTVALLGDDGGFGLGLETSSVTGSASADSEGVQP